MRRLIRRLVGDAPHSSEAQWRLPQGERVYAIGDIHGRSDLLDDLLDHITADNAARGPAWTKLVFLGDLVDRGPDSRGVIERLMRLSSEASDTVFLAGNHEELLIGLWDGNRPLAPLFHRAGGRATMTSYGVSAELYDAWDADELTRGVREHVPESHIAFLRQFAHWHCQGDYLFVHAGIRPGIPIDSQDVVDLHWIRSDFTGSEANHGCMVVHGHSIRSKVDERPNRIGIDTGAYSSGILTAIGIEGTERWQLATGPEDE